MKIETYGAAIRGSGSPYSLRAPKSNPIAFAAKQKTKEPEAAPKRRNLKAALLIGAATLAATAVILAKKGKIPLPEKMKEFLDKHTKLTKEQEKPWLAIMALAGIGGYEAGQLTKSDTDEILEKLNSGDSDLQRSSYTSQNQIHAIQSTMTNATLDKYSKDFYGLSLLTQDNVLNKNIGKYNKAVQQIQNVGFEKLTSKEKLPPLEKENPVIWSVTSEFAPVKEGGLGSVPPEIRNNAIKLGVQMPTFVPMYLNSGMQNFTKKGDTYSYTYKGKQFDLEKLADFKMDVFSAGRPKSVPVSIFLNETTDDEGNKRQLVFIKCDDYFEGSIYESNSKTEEPEKFAVMSKAIYEFAKLLKDGPSSSKEVTIESTDALSKIGAPDALILNDWQASPLAALCRYKAGMENAYGQLSDKTTEELQNMRIITIGHNAMYQGSTQLNNNNVQRKCATNNILNTLFDKYAYDIVQNAKLRVEDIDPDDEDLKNLDNVLVLNADNPWFNHTNFLNMGIILSDYFCPVSKNYAQELISPEHPDLSYILQWSLIQKDKSGKMVGVINGNDFNGLSIEATKARTKSLTGLDLETYKKGESQSSLLSKRAHNKISMYNDYILPLSESKSSTSDQIKKVKDVSSRLEFYNGEKGTILPTLTDDEIIETPILTSGGRLVSQKGINVLCDAIKILFDNWEEDFPNQQKPIFYIAGADGENGTQRAMIENLKNNELTKEDNNRVVFAHGFAPMSGLMASSDYFLMPSIFEPCGLTQGESLAVATPVIASAVGGIVDTVNRNHKENGILTTKGKPLDAQEYYETMKKALDIFFNNKSRYNLMVKNALNEDFSWIQPNRQGPVYDYLELMGIDRSTLPDIQRTA